MENHPPMQNKKIFTILGWIAIVVFIAINTMVLYQFKTSPSMKEPFPGMRLEKPTLLIIFQEFECQSCVESFKILNGMNGKLKDHGLIEIKGLIVSENNTDSKSIAAGFNFPFVISDDFDILKRLNIKHTPVLIGLSKTHGIFYSEVIPPTMTITEKYLEGGILDRLYYTNTLETE